jgi:hypothetical protein
MAEVVGERGGIRRRARHVPPFVPTGLSETRARVEGQHDATVGGSSMEGLEPFSSPRAPVVEDEQGSLLRALHHRLQRPAVGQSNPLIHDPEDRWWDASPEVRASLTSSMEAVGGFPVSWARNRFRTQPGGRCRASGGIDAIECFDTGRNVERPYRRG